MLASSARPPQFGTQSGSKKIDNSRAADRNLIKDKELAKLYQAHQHRLATHTYKDAEMTRFAMMAYPLHNKLKQGQLNSTTRYPRNLKPGSITWLDISTPWNTLYRRFLCLDVFIDDPTMDLTVDRTTKEGCDNSGTLSPGQALQLACN
jgi:hypothetical protein